MATVKISKTDKSLTVITVSGVATCDEIILAFDNFIQNGVTPNLLWDYNDADLSKITDDDMKKIAEFAKTKAHLRKDGRTALLSSQDFEFGMLRKHEAHLKINQHTMPHCVFRDLGKAIAWLNS